MTQADSADREDPFDAQIIPLRLAITAMRDSGYKNTAYALAELIDNAAQADASTIEVLCMERRELVQTRERRRLCEIAVLDNGSGMDALTLRMALQFGNGTRLGDRTGIGRFGMGLPNASISQAARVDVWSWQNGPDNALRSFIDVNQIEAGTMRDVPAPVHDPLPDKWRDLSDSIGQSGTLVVWSNLDLHRLTWKSASHTFHNTERIVGRIYRRFIMEGKATIRLFAMEEGNGEVLHDREAVFNDPLYLTASSSVPSPFNDKPMFMPAFGEMEASYETHEIEYEGNKHTVTVLYSVALPETVTEAGTIDRGKTNYGRHARGNIGVSVMRAGREIMLDPGWCIGYDPRERWWGAEVEFPPTLDELFGVTNNKQAATHFSELATVEWEQLAEEGETFMDVVERLKEDGDPRGWLLSLADSIKRNLGQLRDIVKAQGAGRRSTRRTRHNTPDDVTKTVNDGWKERSKERPIEGEETPPTDSDLDDIRTDLTENKMYSEADAAELVSLIKDADLKVVFLEADFPDGFNLFNVEMKGNITEITFNRQHPAFDDIFGTVATVDEDVSELSQGEILERLARAVNAAKIVFAAWARYEREAGVDRLRALRQVRHEWGQIAAKFLQPEDDLVL